MAAQPEKMSFRDRLRQFGVAFSFTRAHDKLLPLWLAASFLIPFGIGIGVAAYTGRWLIVTPLAVLLGVIGVLVIFGRRVAKATYAEVEGKPGAAAAIIQNMRGNWRVAPAVGFTPQQDLLHRVIGRPGIVLVVEGSAQRLRNMVAQEKKRINRIAPETPIYEVVVGDADGQVPLRRLQTHFVKLPRNITARQVNALEARLTALGGGPPIPKAPLPKNVRMPKGMKIQRR